MVIKKIKMLAVILSIFVFGSAYARDILLEFKAAYFLSTNCVFKNIYNKGGALYGPEVTFQLGESEHWYGFASVDYLQKNGRSLGLGNTTQVQLAPLGIGIKYFMPSYCKHFDFYLGLGFQPVHATIKNCSPYVAPKSSRWGFGGIAKVGAYVDLTHNFLLDLFIDYSFVKVNFKTSQVPSGPVTPLKANISGAIFGVGLGYRFN